MSQLLQVIWFLIPAGMANLVPPIAAKVLPAWTYPMDCNLTFRGQRLLGSHKTMRGLVSGVLLAFATHQLQVFAAQQNNYFNDLAISPVYYELWWLGPWIGFTALAGDALKSFIKRQLQISPGRPWLPWDKIDWIIGTMAGCWFILQLSFTFVVIALITGLLLSTVGRIVGYWFHINKDWL